MGTIGTISTGNYSSALLKESVQDTIFDTYKDIAGMITILKKLGPKKKATNMLFSLLNGDIEALASATTAAVTAAAAVPVMAGTGVNFAKYDSVAIYTAAGVIEASGVVESVSTDTLTLNAAVTCSSGSTVAITGKAVPEGLDIEGGIYVEPDKQSNYIQPFADQWKITDVMKFSAGYGPDTARRQKDQMMRRFLRRIVVSLYMGKKATPTVASTADWTTGGMLDTLSTNKFSGSSITETAFASNVKDWFAKGGSRKLLACSGTMLNTIWSWGLADRQVPNYATKLGLSIREYMSPNGPIMIYQDRILDKIAPAMAFGIDLDYLGTAELIPMRKHTPAQGMSTADEGGISWYMGWNIANESAHALWYQIS